MIRWVHRLDIPWGFPVKMVLRSGDTTLDGRGNDKVLYCIVLC